MIDVRKLDPTSLNTIVTLVAIIIALPSIVARSVGYLSIELVVALVILFLVFLLRMLYKRYNDTLDLYNSAQETISNIESERDTYKENVYNLQKINYSLKEERDIVKKQHVHSRRSVMISRDGCHTLSMSCNKGK